MRAVISVAILLIGCARPPPRPPIMRPIEPAPPPRSEVPPVTLASFADELGLSLEPSKLEDETTATEVYIFNRGSRNWVIALETTPDGERSVQLAVRDVDAPDRALPPAPIGITAQCPRAPSHDVIVVGPGERGLLACVERLVDVRHIDELELEAALRFKATDGSEIHVRSPAFRVARRPVPPTSKSRKK